ncbi:MAG: riboflavin synthase [Elusimicrobiota bacterium]
MFTGLVEDCGRVVYVRGNTLCIETVLTDIKAGDSLMVDGVCLTVTDLQKKNRYIMDIGAETMKKSALLRLRTGSRVNLERAMVMGGRLGGHIVYGHVMEVGKIISSRVSGKTKHLTIRASRGFTARLSEKGSVAVNGVSLTVNEVGKDYFKVGIIPETVKRTNLDGAGSSLTVNLEADIIAMKERS